MPGSVHVFVCMCACACACVFVNVCMFCLSEVATQRTIAQVKQGQALNKYNQVNFQG